MTKPEDELREDETLAGGSSIKIGTPQPLDITFHSKDGEMFRLKLNANGEVDVIVARDITMTAAARAFWEVARSQGWCSEVNWQSMETAPKDGTPLLLFARASNAEAVVVVVGYYLIGRGWVECAFHPNNAVGVVPFKWAPRPPFPISPP